MLILFMSWIENIAKGIGNVFEKCRKPLAAIPTILLLYEINKRPGLSAIALASAIISRLSEAGIVSELNPDGTQNKICKLIRIISEEFVNELHNNAQIVVGSNIGNIMSIGTGSNAGGPVVVQSQNMLPFQIKGILR